MKMCLVLLIVLATWITGCCSNEYCAPHKPIQIFDEVIVTQFKEGFGKTNDNLHAIGGFLTEDFRTSGSRLSNTASTIYASIGPDRCGEGLRQVSGMVSAQVTDGITGTRDNLRVIRKYLCICGD
jgi:hypothetical protein